MLQLINPKETYEVSYKIDGEEPAVFVLRKLSSGEVNTIDDEITISKGDTSFAYLGGTSNRLKIKMALVDWKNVAGEGGKAVPCTDANKELLPSSVQQFLIRRIDTDNGLNKTKKSEQDEKN